MDYQQDTHLKMPVIIKRSSDKKQISIVYEGVGLVSVKGATTLRYRIIEKLHDMSQKEIKNMKTMKLNPNDPTDNLEIQIDLGELSTIFSDDFPIYGPIIRVIIQVIFDYLNYDSVIDPHYEYTAVYNDTREIFMMGNIVQKLFILEKPNIRLEPRSFLPWKEKVDKFTIRRNLNYLKWIEKNKKNIPKTDNVSSNKKQFINLVDSALKKFIKQNT